VLLSQFIRSGSAALEALYPPREARSLVERLVEELQGVKAYETVLEPGLEVSPEVEEGLARLLRGEPLQYVTGVQEFYGRRFHVAPGVLIPRPETEILVREACVHALQLDGPRVLDLCTGSGCIAWSIFLEVPGAIVTAVDISDDALAIACTQNEAFLSTNPQDSNPSYTNSGDFEYGGSTAGGNCLRKTSASLHPSHKWAPPVHMATGGHGFPEAVPSGSRNQNPLFLKADVLAEEEFPGGPFDIIVANPPYIRESERAAMHRNVLEHEPALALFVSDEDPLLFYRAIAGHARRQLAPGGWGMVEINEALGRETAAVFEAADLRGVQIIPDYFGRDRFVSFSL
jgi:release factor glutamine methyltransferase